MRARIGIRGKMKDLKAFMALICLLGGLGLMSCNNSDKENNSIEEDIANEPSVCDCVNGHQAMQQKMQDAQGDEETIMAIEKEFSGLRKRCEKKYENASEEEQQAFLEQVKDCNQVDED